MLEKIIALKEDILSVKNKVKILVLVGVLIILFGGIIISISYLSKSNKKGNVATVGTTAQNTLLRPDWDPQTRDICGDGICGITEEAGKNKCSRDCSSKVPIAIDHFTVNSSVVTPGQTAVLSWSSTAEFCASSGSDDAYFVTGGAPSGSVHTPPLQLSKTYTLSCMNNAGEMQTKEVTVTVESPIAKPTAKKLAPTITFTATPSTITEGQSTTLFWIVSNATFCLASGGASWGWMGERGTKGTQVTPALSISEIYTLTCRGAGGSTTKNIRVTVNKKSIADGGDLVDAPSSGENTGLAPYVTFRTNPASIESGKTTTILWYSTDATSCTAGGDGASWGWKGAIPTSGAKITPPLDTNQSFAITCTNKEGVATTENASVGVTPPSATIPAPKISFTTNGVDKAKVASGETAAIIWSSENATSCNTTDYGGESWDWHGKLPLSGTRTTPALTSSQTYHITCVGDGGSVTKYVTVTIPVSTTVTLPTLKITTEPKDGRQSSGCFVKINYEVTPKEGATCDRDSISKPSENRNGYSFGQFKTMSENQEVIINCDTKAGSVTSSVFLNTANDCYGPLFYLNL